MPNHLVERIEKGKFNIAWEGKPDTSILLDFNPVIEAYQLDNAYVLAHWQAIPKGLRRWGLYCGLADNYYSCEAQDVMIGKHGKLIRFLQIPELLFPNIRPTALVVFDGVKVQKVQDKYLVN